MTAASERDHDALALRGRVVTLSAGPVRKLRFRDRTIDSAIGKTPLTGAVYASILGLQGDAHGDPDKHGGPDKALCVYPSEHYRYFEHRLRRRLPHPSFGENLTTEGLLERDVCVGDTFRIGTAIVQVSLPRNPCYRLAAYHGVREMALFVEQSGFTGFYLRVLEPGRLAEASAAELIDRLHPHATVAEANRVMHHHRYDRAALEALLVPELGASWRRTFERRLAGGKAEDPGPRRYGRAEA